MTESERPNDFDAVQADLRRLRADIAALAQTLAGLTATRAAAGLGAARDAGEQVSETLHRLSEETRRVGGSGLEALEQKIVERPVTAVLAALGLGLLLGRLTDRR